MKWFNAHSIDELRVEYKTFLIKYHPDNNPDADTTEIMQEINAEYDALLKQLISHQSFSSNYSTEKESDELIKVLNEVMKLNADILIELIGTWLWVSGKTHSVKERLKELGFKWTKKKQMWYWGKSTHRGAAYLTIDDIRARYGSTVYRPLQEENIRIH